MEKKKDQFNFPSYFRDFLILFFIVVIIFTVNPFFETNFLVRLVGLKVWIFYLLFIFIGFEFIENEYELKRLCNFFAIVAIIPCVIGILQYLGSFYIGQRETMSIFYGGNLMHAKMSTQGFGVFHWGAGVRVFRLPSTFSFSAQFSVFTLCAFIPGFALCLRCASRFQIRIVCSHARTDVFTNNHSPEAQHTETMEQH